MKKLILFFSGFACCLLCVFLIFIFTYPASQSEKMRAGDALVNVQKYKDEVAQLKLKNEVISSFLLTKEHAPKNMQFLYRSSDGDLIFNTLDNYLLWLQPIKTTDGIGWECKGESQKNLPEGCF